jgi:hypothetical protein
MAVTTWAGSLIRYIYKSASTQASAAMWKSILAQSRKNNPRLGITGALFFDGQQYLQVLEGNSEHVDQLFLKISNDPRHEDVELLAREKISARLFTDWSMGFAGPSQMQALIAEVGDDPAPFERRINAVLERLQLDRRLLARVMADGEAVLHV